MLVGKGISFCLISVCVLNFFVPILT